MVDIALDPRWDASLKAPVKTPFSVRQWQQHKCADFKVIVLVAGTSSSLRQAFRWLRRCEGGRDYDAANISDAQLWNVICRPLRRQLTLVLEAWMSVIWI